MSNGPSLRDVVIFAPQQRVEIVAALESALFHEGPPLIVTARPTADLAVPEGIALVIATSGSTGAAKYVLHASDSLLASARATHQFLGALCGERWSLRLPLDHIAGVMVLVRSLLLGSSPAIEANADYQAIVPTQLFRALHGDQNLKNSLQQSKAILVGGGAIEKTLLDVAISEGINAITTYGMSETAGGCVYNGSPLVGVTVTTHADDRIFIAGPVVAKGYLKNEEGFQSGGFLTQDLGFINDGILKIFGRVDDVVISGGEKIHLREVSDSIRSMPGVKDLYLFATTDLEWGERIGCALVSDRPITLAEIRDHVSLTLPRVGAPRALIHLSEIPLQGIGKPDHATLRALPFSEEI